MDLVNFRTDITSHIQSNLAASGAAISSYNIQQPQTSNYYFLFNILRYLWDKFYENKPENRLEVVERGEQFELIQIPGKRQIGFADDRAPLQNMKEYIDEITDDIVYTLLSFEVDRKYIHRLVDEFIQKIYLIERDIRWNKGLKGRCGWERNFWGTYSMRMLHIIVVKFCISSYI